MRVDKLCFILGEKGMQCKENKTAAKDPQVSERLHHVTTHWDLMLWFINPYNSYAARTANEMHMAILFKSDVIL